MSETIVPAGHSKKIVIALALVYVAGVAYEYYSIPATDPDKTKKAFGWPYYFGLGLIGVFQGTHTFSPPTPPTP